jgi:hypothetical protein
VFPENKSARVISIHPSNRSASGSVGQGDGGTTNVGLGFLSTVLS